VIQQPGVTTVIPGARSTGQARQNAEAASLPPLPQAELGAIEGLYDKYSSAPRCTTAGELALTGNPQLSRVTSDHFGVFTSGTVAPWSITIKYRYRARKCRPIGTKLGR